MNDRKLKPWQMWSIFGASMVAVFVLGLLVSSLAERRAEVASIFHNRKTVLDGQEPRNELFKSDFPREYETWAATADTTFASRYNSSDDTDVLSERPNMVILWAGMLSLGSTRHPADTCMPSKIWYIHCVPVLQRKRQTEAYSRVHAGLVNRLMYPV